MPNQIVEIEVSIPDGYIFDCFRVPYPGDLYIVDGSVRERKCDTSIGFPCVIVRKDWVWPDWLKASWIAMDRDCEWNAFNVRPFLDHRYDKWVEAVCGDGEFIGGTTLDPDLFRFQPPPCDDWTNSLRANPAYVR